MQSSQSSPGQIAAAIAAAAVANRVPPASPAAISHGHEEEAPKPVLPVADLLDQLTGKTHGAETATDPS